MRPLYQYTPSIPQSRNINQQPIPPYQYNRPNQIRPMNYPIPNQQQQMNTNYIPQNNDNIPKKIPTIKPIQQQSAIQPNSTTKKKSFKFEKPINISSAKQINYSPSTESSSFSPYQSPLQNNNIRRQQSQPDLRTTCPNVFKKIQHNPLRNTTHGNGLSKYGAMIAQEQQKYVKKNLGNVQGSSPGVRMQAPFKTITQSKKTVQKPTFKSLNQAWTNKVINNNQKPKKTIINGFQLYKQLGKGKFGQVYLSRHIQTGFIVALKKIIKAKVLEYKMIQQFKRQIRLHSALDHPNIVKFYGFFEDAENIYLILEYISGGTLFDYLAEKDMLSPKEAAQYLRDTIQALSYMHERSIAHRDIKPENIVLTAQKVAKLCDFGWSALVQSSRTTYCGTFDYAPPQILQRKNYDTAVDIWCIGVLTFQLLTGRVPFEGEKRKQIMQKILSVDKTKIMYPVEIPDDAKNFIESLVQKDPNLRPKCKDLLKHPFFTNNLKNSTINSAIKDRKV